MYPTITDYNRVLQRNDGTAFTTLHNLVFVPSRTVPTRIFTYGSGSYAVIFKAKEGDNQFAIRCFISANQENYNRYKKLYGYLKNISASWVTQLQFLENEICVNNQTYPVIKMDWVNGVLLNEYISDNLYNNDVIEKLQKALVALSVNLEEISVGHGDIQCGNVIISKHNDGKLLIKLIDYDGMFIPAFRNKINLEGGRTEFQHPNRKLVNFDEKIDRFSFWVIICALEALKHDKTLWRPKMQGGFNSSDNLLFEGQDFANFKQSKLVSKLYGLNNNALNYYLNQLDIFCYGNPNEVALPKLYSGQSDVIVERPSIPNKYGTQIQIVTTPSGVIVSDRRLKKIGITPLTLNREDAEGKEYILSFGDFKKTIIVEKHHTIIDITFSAPTIVKPLPKPKVEEHKAETESGETQTTVTINPKYPISDILTMGIITLCILAILALIIVEVAKSNNASSNNPVTPQTAATASAVDATGASDTALKANNTVESQVDSASQLPKTDADLVYVQGGSFSMGSNEHDEEKPVHTVTVSSFYMSKYEVTLAEFKAFIDATGYSTTADKEGFSFVYTGGNWQKMNEVTWRCGVDGSKLLAFEMKNPVVHVSWDDAIKYCAWKTSTKGKNYRLPTEAEWEYAARGGAKSNGYTYSGSYMLDDVAWYFGNSGNATHPVGQKQANELGLYDMTGNVWEWCSDWYGSDYYSQSPSQNPTGASSGEFRVIRGGSWNNDAAYRVASRGNFRPTNRISDDGFRVLVDP